MLSVDIILNVRIYNKNKNLNSINLVDCEMGELEAFEDVLNCTKIYIWNQINLLKKGFSNEM